MFQSHNGSIVTDHPGDVPCVLSAFQSHNGSIVTWRDSLYIAVATLTFQSHNGSIVTGSFLEPREALFTKFQSHNGSIVTPCAYKYTTPATPVSIPQWFDCDLSGSQRHFTPHLFQSHNGSIVTRTSSKASGRSTVSIPQWFDCDEGHVQSLIKVHYLFQSHNGSIVTRVDCGAVHREGAGFNPTMVRL